MKKFIMTLLVIAMIFSFSATVFAANENSEQEQYSNIKELVQHWETNGYPNFVGSVYSSDGSSSNLTILLVDDDGTAEKQIRSWLINDSGVLFGEAQYSYNSLLAISNEIMEKYMVHEQKVNAVSVGWTSIDGVVTGFGESGKEARVVVFVEDSVLAEYTSEFKTIYGDMVMVEVGGAAEEIITAKSNNALHWWFLLSVMLVIGIGVVFFNRTRLIPALQTANGNVVMSSPMIRRKETIEAIKNNKTTPDDAVFASILSKVKQNETD